MGGELHLLPTHTLASPAPQAVDRPGEIIQTDIANSYLSLIYIIPP